ncbi:hypothetical protein GPJ56_007808 [Histomonas meleagridis]|uniref:uncharacterized protein n=1 Tax=Histomonas meleagridis TaxID=135588 RepID=UPI00355AAFFD|nr:hypothetical protein GPJ56_007808 [Histomonas meleagridis]KAH0798713.1 hypothetical protein GO595_008578 [Histomonas meleagridis]
MKITSIINSAITALFGESINHTFRFECATDVKPEFAKQEYKYKTDSVLADRFTSFLLANRHLSKSTAVDQIAETIELLKATKDNFTFTGDITASSFIDAIGDSIANDNNISSLTFKGLNFSSFLPHFLPILQNNTNITKLTFISVTFIDSIDNLPKSPSKPLFPVRELHFIGCELTTSSFLSFVRYLQTIGSELFSVSFVKSQFSENTIVNLFKFFQTSKSFDSLRSLHFEAVRSNHFQKCLTNLFSTESKGKKELISLSLIDCGLDLSVVLPVIVASENILEKLCLSKNKFTNPLEQQINDFGEITTISFSECSFSVNSLKVLFNSLSSATNHPNYLLFDSIHLDSESFYDELLDIHLQDLMNLSWKKNKMNSTSAKKFFNFLSNHPDLFQLDISNTFIMDDIDTSMKYFLEYIKKCKLNTLIIRGEQPTVYGEHLYPILEELTNGGFSLKVLDVTGQEIKEKGLDYLSQIVANGLEDISFDGSAVKSVDAFIHFCQGIICSELIKAHWPERDEKHLLSVASVNQSIQIKKLIKPIKKEFIEHFAENLALLSHTSSSRSFSEMSRQKLQQYNTMTKSRSGSHCLMIGSSTIQLPKLVNTSDLIFREESISKLCTECLGYEPSLTNDVLLTKYYQILNRTK